MKLNPAQQRVRDLIKDPTSKFILVKGGTGGGKTFAILDCVIERAMAAPGSTHVVFRSTLNDVKSKLFFDTFRALLELKFPVSDGSSTWDYLRQEGALGLDPPIWRAPNGSVVQFRGLDEGDLERALGPSYSTIVIDEVSNIDNFLTIEFLRTRLRQQVMTHAGTELRMKFIMTCNPPSERHWTFAAFRKGANPETGRPHSNPAQWRWIQVDGEDNRENLAEGYLEDLQDQGHIGYQRFVLGDWYKDVDNPLFHSSDIAAARLPVMTPEEARALNLYIEVSIDPAVSKTIRSDETGIMVVGRDDDRHAYVLADLSGKYQPEEWAKVAIEAYQYWGARWIIAEKNQGGNLVERNIRVEDEFVPIKLIHASQGKEVRAEPTSTAYRAHRVHHCGEFRELENQLLDMETNFDRKKKGSPDRLDALVHALNSLILTKEEPAGRITRRSLPGFWRTD